VGGSASVGALIVGTVLLSIFANAMVITLENRQRFEDIDEDKSKDVEVRVVNATLVTSTLFINITNDGSDPVLFSDIWIILDGGNPLPFTDYFSSNEYLFPGENVMGSDTVPGTPNRAFVSSYGHGSGVTIQ
jgi:archaellum component FlaF (FlaF/FlaG flagellin family)